MKILQWLNENLEEKLMGICLWSIVVIMGIQVIMRYVFQSSLTWSEEFSRYLFIACAFIGMSYGIKEKTHMRIDILETFIPKLKKPLEIIGDASFLFFAIYLIGPGMSVISALKASGQASPAARMPMYLVYSVLLVGLMLVVFRIVQKYGMQFNGLQFKQKNPKEVSEEV